MSVMLWLLLAALLCLYSCQSLRIRQRRRAHETLLERVKRLRFYKMLTYLGADPDEYLRAVPLADINQQMQRCMACTTLEICDRCLGEGRRVDNLDFCPNHQSISEHSKTVFEHRLHDAGSE